jgi:hypothetical protein
VPTCEECGSRRVGPRTLEGASVLLCGLCGHLQGEEAEVARVRERIEARERGFEAEVYPLVRALEAVPTFTVESASTGHPERGEYPFVFLRLAPGALAYLERLLTSLEMANRATRRRWVVECALQRGLLFILRPRFWKAVSEITARDIAEARSDLSVLAETLRRDMGLDWWGLGPDARR